MFKERDEWGHMTTLDTAQRGKEKKRKEKKRKEKKRLLSDRNGSLLGQQPEAA